MSCEAACARQRVEPLRRSHLSTLLRRKLGLTGVKGVKRIEAWKGVAAKGIEAEDEIS